MSVYQHWDKLKTCMVGKSYPPEFYSWIKNPKARTAMEKIAQETEEDYQRLIKILKKFDVNIIRPEVCSDHEEYFIPSLGKFREAPMTPRDVTGSFGDKFYVQNFKEYFKIFYNNVKDPTWPNANTLDDIHQLPEHIKKELYENFNLQHEIENWHLSYDHVDLYIDALKKNNVEHILNPGEILTNTATVCRIGKDLIYPGEVNHSLNEINDLFGNDYRINFYNGSSHADSCFCPVVPGLIISLKHYLDYERILPNWEVVELPGQSWDKVHSFLRLKRKNAGKWWVPGEEENQSLITCVEDWLDNWVGYVEETVFDVNMLVLDQKNVIVNNYNKKVFDALERHGVTPHISNFRHRYFWDGGIHCITADIEREGEMIDYFPDRN